MTLRLTLAQARAMGIEIQGDRASLGSTRGFRAASAGSAMEQQGASHGSARKSHHASAGSSAEFRQPTRKSPIYHGISPIEGGTPQEMLWRAIVRRWPKGGPLDPRWEHPVEIAGKRGPPYRLDIGFPGLALGVEVDGWQYHGRFKADFRRDREREQRLALAGWRLYRVAAGAIREDLEGVMADLERMVTLQGGYDNRPNLLRHRTMSDQENTYQVSVQYERWTPEDTEVGEASERGTEIEREEMDDEDLIRAFRNFGIHDPSDNSPSATTWFRTTAPREDREYFEQGVNRFFSLHIHEVNGQPPTAEDIQRIADRMGVLFREPLVQEVSQAEPQQADTDPEPGDGIYGYYIDLDERGDFQADVRDTSGKTVFEVRAGDSLGEDETSLVEDGFMADLKDVDGLTGYLRDLKVIPPYGAVLSSADFERYLEEVEEGETEEDEFAM